MHEESVSVNEDRRSCRYRRICGRCVRVRELLLLCESGFQRSDTAGYREAGRRRAAPLRRRDGENGRRGAADGGPEGPCRGDHQRRYGLGPETGQGRHARLEGRFHHHCRQGRQRGGPRPLGEGGRQRPEPAEREESPGGRGLHGDRGRDRGEVFPEGGRPGKAWRQGRGLRHDGRGPLLGRVTPLSTKSRRCSASSAPFSRATRV